MDHKQEEEERKKNNIKWQGMVSVELSGATAGQVWSLLGDFLAFHKWLPTVGTCRHVDGEPGLPGCVRYCASSQMADGGEPAYWVKERLVSLDSCRHSCSYEIVDSNMGFGMYLAEFRVVEGGRGCRVEWLFEAEPVKGWTEEGLISYLQNGVEAIAAKLHDALHAAATASIASS